MIPIRVDYSQKVEKIQRELREKKGNLSLLHHLPSKTLRHSTSSKGSKIDLGSLCDIIAINTEEMWADCESRVTIYDLCKACLKKGVVPLVVPEFKTITVGGAIMGAALESSSFRYGQFNDSCLEMDLLLANAEMVTATPDHHPDLFWGVSGSYGTLATITRARIALRKADPFVRLCYHHFTSPEELFSFFETCDSDFIDGVMLSQNTSIAITASFTSSSSLPLFSQRTWASEWFIDHVSKVPSGHEERMRTSEYLFRFDRGGFWIGKTLTDWKHILKSLFRVNLLSVAREVKERKSLPCNSLLMRALLGWSFSSKALYSFWHRVPKSILENLFFIHDFYIPREHAASALGYLQQKTGILPVWLCPIKGSFDPQFLSPHFGKESFINLGLYGIPRGKNTLQLNHDLEKEMIHWQGRKMLYSYTYYTPEEFALLYDQKKYEELRKKYGGASRYPSLYEKVTS